MTEKHQQKLLRVCRICGNLTGKDSLTTASRTERIFNVFKINTKEDCVEVHPPQMCLKCYSTMKNIETRGNKLSKIKPKIWLKCPTKECMCIYGKVGRKPSPNVGRPGVFKRWTQLNINLFLESLPLPLNKKEISEFNIQLNPHITLCICKVCGRIMHQPVMIKDCQHSFCSQCIISIIKGKLENEARCPVCLTCIMINSLCSSVHVLEMIEHLYIACKICKKNFIKDKYENHECKKDHLLNNSSTIVDDLFKVDKSSHIPRNIEDAVLHVIKQKMENSKTTTIEFLSGGPRPLCLTVMPKAYKESASCSGHTLRKRHKHLVDQANHQVGNSKDSLVVQTSVMLKSFDHNQKNKVLESAKIGVVEFSAEELVAFKANVGVPWNKLKTMTRWLNSRNIKTASNFKQRVVANTWAGNDLVVLNGDFTFQNKNNKSVFEIKHAPWAYIDNLPTNIKNLLDILESFKLIKHDGIKNDEIHIKIGGDHGGGSFKMSYQIVNQDQPNSKSNSIVLSTFEARDYRTNLKVGLSRYTLQVDEIQKMIWQNHNVRVFIFGDYDFLCSVYGITGASGRHCCLFCDITKESIQLAPISRENGVSQRSLKSLNIDFNRFQSSGGNLKKAKFFNNVINETLFHIPLDQVAVPALHISLGTYLKFFNMFEDECHLLDIKLAGELALKNNTIGKDDFDKYINMHIQSNLIKSVIEDCDNKITLLQDTISLKVLCEPDRTEEIRKVYAPRILYYDLKKTDKMKELNSLNEANILDKISGPCIQQLDEILKANQVQRQAYHGKCFVGNHVHTMLKPQPLLDLCNSIPKLISNLGFIDTEVHLLSVNVSQKFKQLFQYYSKCHNLMNSSQSFQENDVQELDQLGQMHL
ncbi:uncharacterized protein LOC105850185 isoform X2 [Hydra vulgaris]|uniref:uncharacterized protein LOC105850185 isoform X2 n=1 Tax=Hydra vulgaris TaxID=6087 RepID=UPI0032EA170F